jgi:hypothetical protein
MSVDGSLQEQGTPWEDVDFSEHQPPADWIRGAQSFDDASLPPQIVRTVNVLPIPEHSLDEDDVQGIADFLVERAKEGIGDIFELEDYYQLPEFAEASGAELFARAIAEHQTGIPYTQPVYFYPGGQKAVAAAVASAGRYPLVGQCQQSVTTALCIGGWDGGTYGDIGSSLGAQRYCAKLGKGWTQDDLKARSKRGGSGLVLADWSDELWNEIEVGACLFWSAPCPMTKDGQTCAGSSHVAGCGMGSGHVAMVIRKHPTARKWQLWDTQTSFVDPAAHPAAQSGARMLWESHWWEYVPESVARGAWPFRGIGAIAGIGRDVLSSLAPRGRCRLILRRRSDKTLLHRSEWMSMESEGLPISWLLRSLRGAPHADAIEPTWVIDSPGEDSKKPALPLLDCTCDAKGNAKMAWTPNQGSHQRAIPATVWSPAAPYPDAGATAATAAKAAPAEAREPAEAPQATAGALQNPPLAGRSALDGILAGRAAALQRGSKGDGVKAVQEALMALDYEVPGGADGIFGAGLESAVKAFQQAKELGADGKVGKGTLRALDEALGG